MTEFSLPESQKHTDTKMDFQRTDISGFIQHVRGKQNIEYVSPEGKAFFAKYSTLQADRRDTVAGLVNEKKILDKLSHSGITPQAGEIKLYPNQEKPQRARFIIERLPAVPLNHHALEAKSKFANSMAPEVVVQSAQAYQRLHEMGVLQVDVNPGNVMLQKNAESGGLEVRLVDFELGLDLDQATDDQKQEAWDWLASNDPALPDMKPEQVPSTELLQQAEIHQWAKMMCHWLLGADFAWTDPKLPDLNSLPSEKKAIVEKITNCLAQRAKEDFANLESEAAADVTEAELIQQELDLSLSPDLSEAFLSDTLEERLKDKHILLPDAWVQFLIQALSNDLSARPQDFTAILS